MSTKTAQTEESSTSTRSAKRRTGKTPTTPSKRTASLTKYGQAEVLTRSSSSPLADLYKTEEFRNEWANDVRFHVARNLLHLRRYRHMSQDKVAGEMGSSQSAIARIESAQENITLDTLGRMVAALKGRFYVSIQPQECAMMPMHPWWESSLSNPWDVVGYVARHSDRTDQLILALERCGHSDLLGAEMIVADASTGQL
jgi:transcriptional regulator with XRE-family HTH domain